MKILSAALLVIFTLNIAQAQDKYADFVSASLHVNFQPTQGEAVIQNLSLHEAVDFDVPAFIKAHEGKGTVRIFGRQKTTEDYKYFNFDSSKLTEKNNCLDFCEKVTGLERIPYFGLAVTPMDDFTGVRIDNIIEDSNADDSDLQVGDIIISVEANEISNPCNLTQAVKAQEVDNWVEVSYVRDGKTRFTTVLMGYRIRKNITWVPCCEGLTLEDDMNISIDNSLDLAIFPNPTAGITQYEIGTSSFNKTVIQLVNMNGQVLEESIVFPMEGYWQDYLDLSKYADGVYVLHVTQDKAKRSERIVLQKK